MSMSPSNIDKIWAREVLDSRGNPTVEADVHAGGVLGRAIAPSGASTGSHEALEMRDGGPRYNGKGVLNAVNNVRSVLAPALIGMDARDLRAVDERMIAADGTANKSRVGANATTAVSLAAMKAGALAKGVEPHEHLSAGSNVLPVPTMNILNGGKHAGTELRIQEFMVVPAGAPSFSEALRAGAEVYRSLQSILRRKYGAGAINIGDEGGFAPPVRTAPEAMEVIIEAISDAGYSPGKDVFLALDAASSEFYSDGRYDIDGKSLTADELIDYYRDLIASFPLISLEDPFQEDDFDTTAKMTAELGTKVQIMGDDLFVTNTERLRRGIERKAGNAMLLKVNQVGTVTEAMDAAALAKSAGYAVTVSHRSGESEDSSIADIAVALGSGQIKTGAPARGERNAKYNRLLRIEEELGSRARYAGRSAFIATR